jgi:hypothetical protein
VVGGCKSSAHYWDCCKVGLPKKESNVRFVFTLNRFYGEVITRVGKEFISDVTVEPFPAEDLNLLYVGNSNTGYNQLAESTVAVSGGEGVNALDFWLSGEDLASMVRMLNGEPGNEFFNGIDTLSHLLLADGDALTSHYWKWVILQNNSNQGGMWNSSDESLRSIFDESLQAARSFNDIIRDNQPDADTLFLMTWGQLGKHKDYPDLYTDFLTSQDLIGEGHLRYVNATSTAERPTYVAPVGLVYRTIYNDDVLAGIINPADEASGSLFYQLYEKDDHHPSLAGSYIIALTVYSTITGEDANGVSWKPPTMIMDHQLAAKLRDAVSRTIEHTATNGIIRYPWQ